MTIELKTLALSTAAGLTVADEVLPLAQDFYAWLTAEATAGDAPKATRKRATTKTDGASESGAASESTTPSESRPPLVADDVDQARADQRTEEANTVVAVAEPAEPTQEDKDALLKEATEFSQKHGHDALLAALKAVGAERFSAIAFDKYPAFRAEMAKTAGSASALS